MARAKEELTVKVWEIANLMGWGHLWSFVAPRLEDLTENQAKMILDKMRH